MPVPHDLYLIIAGAGVGVSGIAYQIRMYLRDRGDRRLARYVFDQTRRTEALDGYVRLVRERHASLRPRRQREPEHDG